MAEIAESETDNQPDLHNGQTNTQFLTKNGEKMDVDNKTDSMETENMVNTKVLSAGPEGDSVETIGNGPKYDDIKISKDGDNFVNIDTVKKPFSDFIHLDDMSAMSGDSGGIQDTHSIASMTASGTSSSNKSPNHKPDKEKGQILVSAGRSDMITQNGKVLAIDHVKKEKEKEREDKIRQQKEKLAEERQKKLEEMKEQQRLAQEKREKQLELRRLKIEELRRRDDERRHAVEERRRRQETEEMARRESIIQKSQDRITRFEQWKASGRKGGSFGGGTPPNKHLSMSTSVLYNKRSSDIGGSTGNLSVKDRPGSLLALNTISEKRRSFLAGNGPPPTRPKSSINLNTKENIKLRERSTPRKPRPSSVATSMPSFMHVESPSPKMRSKSSDRVNRDKPKGAVPPQPKFTPKKEKDALNKQEKSNDKKDEKKKFDPRILLAEKRKAEQQKKAEEAKREGSPEKTDKSKMKISQSSIDRLSAPKQVKVKEETPTKPEPVKATHVRKPPTVPRIKTPAVPRTKTPAVPRTKTLAVPRTKTSVKKAKPTKQKGKENKETSMKDKKTDKSEKISSTEKLDIKEEGKPRSKPSTPTKQIRSKSGSPSKMQVSFDSSLVSSTDAISNDQLFESIEDETLPDLGDSSPDHSESSAREGQKVENLDDSLNKSIEEIQDMEIVAGNFDGEENVKGVVEKSSSPMPDVVPQVEESKNESDEEKVVKSIPIVIEPAVTSTPARESRDLSPASKAGTPASASKSQKELELEEYRAKLAEKRRQAREKAEREAEVERQKQEQLRLEEEERQRKEEEEEKKIEEEAERLAEEARRMEGERLRKAIEAEEQRKKEEAERTEQEKLAREEAERKQKEEAERMEKERIEKIKRDEEERTERKKKLAAIMSKVKSDKNLASHGSDSNLSAMSMSQSLTNLVTNEEEQPKEELTVTTDSTPKFKSPLLQKLAENKQNGGETPKFKSPLLQSLLGKKGRLAEKLEAEKSETETDSDRSDTDTKVSTETRDISHISADCNSDASDSSDNNSVINADTLNNGIHNGHIKELVDSSISMRTVDSLGTSVTDSSLYGSLTDSATTADHKFEQIIDLAVTNAKYNTSDDLLNCNTNISFDNNQEEETLPKPIIAFEDNATRRQEVADFL
ncbi:microtubule-associated protein futsch-like isoform X2 [Mytilus californianus]|uniref:microtubule-associated protein futsch-like isoform X2 n=1 Tax=Mytilus californianus TaxID=6549 RepID=UPI002245937F|nr:microtubule-associated protein futsch-like isoform X2 [Mytilus californianus]